MTEYWQGYIWTLKVFFVLMASMLYWRGGRPGGRLFKRVLAPVLLVSSILAINYFEGNWNNWYLVALPLYINWPWFGYGGKTLWFKIFRRALWSLLYCSAALVFVWWSKAWLIFGVQTGMSLAASIAFGVWNPFKDDAPAEEASIYFGSNWLLPFML